MAQPITWARLRSNVGDAYKALGSSQVGLSDSVNRGVTRLQDVIAQRNQAKVAQDTKATAANTEDLRSILEGQSFDTLAEYNQNADQLSGDALRSAYGDKRINLADARTAKEAQLAKLRDDVAAQATSAGLSKAGVNGAGGWAAFEDTARQLGMKDNEVAKRRESFIQRLEGQKGRQRADKLALENVTPMAQARMKNKLTALDSVQKTAQQPYIDSSNKLTKEITELSAKLPTSDNVQGILNSEGGVVGWLHKQMGHTDSDVSGQYNDLLDKGFNQVDAGRAMIAAYNMHPEKHSAESWGPGIDNSLFTKDMQKAVNLLDTSKKKESALATVKNDLTRLQREQVGEMSTANSFLLDNIGAANKAGTSDYVAGFDEAFLSDKRKNQTTELPELSTEIQSLADAFRNNNSSDGDPTSQPSTEPEIAPQLQPEVQPTTGVQDPTTGRTQFPQITESSANKVVGDALISGGRRLYDLNKQFNPIMRGQQIAADAGAKAYQGLRDFGNKAINKVRSDYNSQKQSQQGAAPEARYEAAVIKNATEAADPIAYLNELLKTKGLSESERNIIMGILKDQEQG